MMPRVFSPEQVAQVQRARILAAMAQAACERGAANVSVADVVGAAGISRRTFYEIFSNCEDCLLATFDDALERIARRVLPAWREDGAWSRRVRAALGELLSFCEEQPLVAKVVFVESQAGGAALLERCAEVRRHLIAAVEEGCGQTANGARPGRLTAEGLVGGVSSVIAGRLGGVGSGGDGKGADLQSLTSGLVSMIVLPYRGATAARREAARPTPRRSTNGSPVGHVDALTTELREANIRLTYRTLRVLLAVGEHPNGSNRQIGQAAGIGDQGQISKLLARLAGIGLIENTRVHPGKGAPNSWALTEKGRSIAEGVRLHAVEEETSREHGALRSR